MCVCECECAIVWISVQTSVMYHTPNSLFFTIDTIIAMTQRNSKNTSTAMTMMASVYKRSSVVGGEPTISDYS